VAKVYTDKFFLSKRQGGMYLRFCLGHNRPIAFYLESEIRIQQVRPKQGIWVKGEPRPVAAHFFVRARDAAKARKILNTIYPSKPRKEYPGDVQ
jgi:hypothetical protein